MQTTKDRVPRSSTWTFTQLFFNVALRPQKPCRLLRMGNPGLPPRLSRSFSSVWLYIHRDLADYKGRGAQDVHLDFHTAFLQCGFTSTETIQSTKDGEPRTFTSTFTQLLSSDWAVIDSIRKACHPQPTNTPSRIVPSSSSNVALYPRRP